jgi:fructokinase
MSSRILGIGEVLWDLLPAGPQMGGAPANFAYHARALGADAGLVSRIGDDPRGRRILKRLRRWGLPTDHVAVDPAAPTGTVSVKISSDGQPQFSITENVAWDRIEADSRAVELAAAAEAVCFGSLAQRSVVSRAGIRKLVAATSPRALRVFDINLRQHYYTPEIIEASLHLANILKINDQELKTLADILRLQRGIAKQIQCLAERYKLTVVALTRGVRGSLLYREGQWSDHPGVPTRVKDTVGAGDAFTAAMVLNLMAGRSLDEVNRRANHVAAYVCSRPGATPRLPARLRKELS